MAQILTNLGQISLDLYNGSVEKYSMTEAETMIKNAIKEACGGDWNYYAFEGNKYKVFQVMAEVLPAVTGTILTKEFEGFVDIHNVALGDKPEFLVEDTSLFRVATISSGNVDIRRQKISGKSVRIDTAQYGVKIYAELDMLMAGRINFASWVNRIALSFANQLGTSIYNGIYNSFDTLGATYKESTTYSESALKNIIANVELATGKEAVIYGTKPALGMVTSAKESDSMKDKLNEVGFYGTFNGTTMKRLPQAQKADRTKAVDDKFLLIVPESEKIGKLLIEGDATILDSNPMDRNDLQKEYYFGSKFGVGVLQADIYGIFRMA